MQNELVLKADKVVYKYLSSELMKRTVVIEENHKESIKTQRLLVTFNVRTTALSMKNSRI